MEVDQPVLFIEINNTNYIFVAGKYDENQNLNIIEKIITSSSGIRDNKFINIDLANEEIKKILQSLKKN